MNDLLTFSQIDIPKAINFLKASDHQLAAIINVAPLFDIKPNNELSLFLSLAESIIYQQLTAKAAATIYKRLCLLFSNTAEIKPLDIIRASDEELRSAGLSKNKASAVRDLAEFELSGHFPNEEKLKIMTNEEIIKLLTKIKGIGRWTAEMVLIFRLNRVDVISLKDYGLIKGLALITGTYPTLPTAKQLSAHSENWIPYRSIASWYLWRATDLFAKSTKIKN